MIPKRKFAVTAVVSAVALVGSLYFSPLVRFLVWLNAGAISAWFHSPRMFVPIAISAGVLVAALFTLLIYMSLLVWWSAMQNWAGKVSRSRARRKRGEGKI